MTDIASIVYSFRPYASRLTFGTDYHTDDLLQDVSLNLLKAKGLPKDESQLQRIACTTLKNCFINFTRWQKKRQCVSFSNEHEQFECCEDAFDSKDKLSSVMDLISKHGNEPQKEALDLYIRGYSYKEIACKTNAPLGTVKARIHGIRTMVKDAFNGN